MHPSSVSDHYESNLATSCFELFHFGVGASGWYLIKPSNVSNAILVYCSIGSKSQLSKIVFIGEI